MSEPISKVTGRLTRQAHGFWEVEGHGVLELKYGRILSNWTVFLKDGKYYEFDFYKFQDLWKQGKAKKL